LVSDSPAKPSPTRERSLLEAYFRGSAMIYLAIGATLTTVAMIMAICGVTFGSQDLLWLLPAFAGAGILIFFARLARQP